MLQLPDAHKILSQNNIISNGHTACCELLSSNWQARFIRVSILRLQGRNFNEKTRDADAEAHLFFCYLMV